MPSQGIGGNGIASEFGDLTGMTRQEVDDFLRGLGAKGLAIKYNPSYARRVGNKKSDMSGCDLCDWDARNDLE